MIKIKKLKEMRDYMASGDWKKKGGFCMQRFISGRGENCKLCVLGHCQEFLEEGRGFPLELNYNTWEFLFSTEWFDFDNTVEGAIGRLDAVIEGLRF